MFTALTIQDANGNDFELITISTTERLTGECHGLHGVPAPRRVVRPLPGGSGEINETKDAASRQPVWNGTIFPVAGSGVGRLWQQYDALLRVLWGMVSEPRLMKWTRDDGVSLQTLVKLAEAVDPVLKTSDFGNRLEYQLVFDREDPRNYAQSSATSTGSALSDIGGGFGFNFGFNFGFGPAGQSGLSTAANAGTIETPATFTIYGQVSNPAIQQTSTGKLITLSGDVGPGATLVLDSQERTVMLGGTDRGNMIDFAGTDWTAGLVPAGGDSYRLLGSSWDVNARLDVTTTAAYA